MLVDQTRRDTAVGRLMRLSRFVEGAVDENQATALEGRTRSSRGEEQSWDSSS